MIHSGRSRWWQLGVASYLVMGGAITLTRCFAISLAAALWAIASLGDCALAQIIPDSTLGSENSTVTPITPTVDQINGGATRGTNLFHSFQEFNIGNGRSAYFTNPAGIENILTRVTGANPSNILGTLGVNSGNANLFLINPNGIIFGQNARLDVGGSFAATTANAIELANGDIFSANPVEPLPNQLLNVNPNAFFFNQIAAQPIINRSTANSTGLQVPQGQSLLLVGGAVRLEGGQMQAPGGRVELGGVAGSGTVGLSVNGNNLRLTFPVGVQRADVSLDNSAEVYVRAGGGGSIAINAQNLNMAGASKLLAGIESGLGSVDSMAGDIEINAIGTINLTNESGIYNTVRPRAVGKAGDIYITTGSLSLTDGAQLQSRTRGQGDAGSVNINARDTVSFDGVSSNGFTSGATAWVERGAVGNGGDINITTGSFSVTNGAGLTASTYDQGNAGSVNINARDTVSFDGVGSNGFPSSVVNHVQPRAVGNGGDINITTGSLSVTDGALLNVSTFGKGNAGRVNINARDTVAFDGVSSNGRDSGIQSNVEPSAVGNGGDINITTGSLSVTDGATLATATYGQGNAGNFNINARDTVSFDGVGSNGFSTAAVSITQSRTLGNGGDINITTRSLSVTNGALLDASNLGGRGDAGSVNINARDTVSFDGVGSNGVSSTAFSSVEGGAVGNGSGINITTGSLSLTNGAVLSAVTRESGDGGNITLNANTLEVINGGQVLTTSFSSGKAGNITVNVTNSVTLSGSDPTYFERLAQFGPVRVAAEGSASGLFANTSETSTAQGGDLRITTGQLNVGDGAEVSVSSEGSGNAGSLRVEAGSIFLNNQGKLQASTASGEGGNIDLQVRDFILMRRNSLISAKADNNGNGGNITINAPFVVAVPSENSDIVANAFRGRGGNINITTQGIFGLEYRQELTPESDINASSEFGVDGTVQINSPDVDPSRGLVNLPIEPANLELTQGCQSGGSQEQSSFVITGRGGLPPNPREALSPDAVEVDLVRRNYEQENRSRRDVPTNSTHRAPTRLVEAQGWVMGNNGEVILTATAPTVTPHNSWQPTANCFVR